MTNENLGTQTVSFEKAVERLNQIIAKLESGDTPLEDSIKLFEEGVTLTRMCSEQLKNAERRVEILTKAPAGVTGGSLGPNVEFKEFKQN